MQYWSIQNNCFVSAKWNSTLSSITRKQQEIRSNQKLEFKSQDCQKVTFTQDSTFNRKHDVYRTFNP